MDWALNIGLVLPLMSLLLLPVMSFALCAAIASWLLWPYINDQAK
ncbi:MULTISPECIES: hypothetical protein [Shewanella]|uniref:Uncharacterized protein n=1 Tax=Shewanella metallivivens TaxID=2872342 RepID=A0ABT5TNH8_9GAMM|nr:hypothetical protein [Shewanella metallivivens]MDD8059793.1 hypothetical protein [Shewanella metallivivens]